MQMQLDLTRLRSRGDAERIDRRFEPADFGQENDDFRVVAPVGLTAEVHKDAKKIRLVGRVTTTLECACSRCLDPFTILVDAPFDSLFLPAAEHAGTDEQEVGDEDLGVSFYTNETIDLGDVMREQFYLSLPMKPLCTDDCRGLCPVCGINRNRESCTCQTEWVDPRLEGLRNLRER